MHWPESLLNALLENPYIVALKEDAKNFEITAQALKLEPNIKNNNSRHKSSFMKYKELGARSYLNGISIIDARIGELFWKSYKNSNEEAIKFILSELEAPFFDEAVSKYGWHRCNKALLQAAGLMHRRERMPLKELSEKEFQDIKETHLLSDFDINENYFHNELRSFYSCSVWFKKGAEQKYQNAWWKAFTSLDVRSMCFMQKHY